MKKIITLLLTFVFCISANAQRHDMKLWYKIPANASVPDSSYRPINDAEWVKSLPLGNGSLGVMVFGDVKQERLQLNEESMWSGSPQNSDNPEAVKHLDEIRNLLFQGKYKEASALINSTQVCTGKGSGFGNGANVPFGCFQTLGDLWLDFENKADYSDYYRELDLQKAIVKVNYRQNNVNFSREIFTSYPNQVMVARFTADKKGQLSFTCKMNRPERYKTYVEGKQLVMAGSLSDGKNGNGLQYMARLLPMVKNGSVTYTDSTFTIKDADEVVLLLTASTDYLLKFPEYKGRDYLSICKRNLSEAGKLSFETLKDKHVKDFQKYFNRVSLQLNTAAATLPTNELIENFKNGSDNATHLYELMFQYGRYLLISSSRPGTLPANLQGIWANKIQTPWNGDFHTDVNVEMNYWPSEVTNLSEMQLPLFDLIASLVKPGMRTAKVQYGKRGWVVHPITNVWGFTSPGENASWGMHTGAPAWICQHIGEHYRFTGDRLFLKKMYPVLKGAVQFYLDWLVKDPKSGKLVSGPAVSPENSFIAPDGSRSQFCMGPTHDQQTIRQLFVDFEMASKELNIKDDFTVQVKEARENLSATKIGSDGRILEWNEEFKETEPGHRHISHVFALYPGAQINLLQTPALAEAAYKTIEYRLSHGGGGTGWSLAWLTSLFARLHKPSEAKASLDQLIKKDLNPNLFTECPPFQIDADFGTTAGIAELLLQSQVRDSKGNYIIELLPALPSEWRSGEVKGLKARGNFEVSMSWKDGKIQKVTLKSLSGNSYKVYYQDKYIHSKALKKGEEWEYSFR
jgi:alpha-L-fucosidase 2